MNSIQYKTGEMPLPARIVAAAIGIALLGFGSVLGFAAAPMSWKVVLGMLVSGGMSFDLLKGSMRAQWPATFLLWIVP